MIEALEDEIRLHVVCWAPVHPISSTGLFLTPTLVARPLVPQNVRIGLAVLQVARDDARLVELRIAAFDQ